MAQGMDMRFCLDLRGGERGVYSHAVFMLVIFMYDTEIHI